MNKTTTLVGRTRLTVHITIQNVLNHPVWSTPGFLGETSINATNFGQTANPINGARQLYTRVSVLF